MEKKTAKTRGFLTLAAGDLHYYQLAANLLGSYRLHSAQPLPFAILADRENRYTAAFDRCILMENADNSYLDKLRLAEYLPYDETIFIDADCLAYGDLNRMFAWFQEADDVSCHGRVLPLTDRTGWFDYENLGQLQQQVSYCVGLHGGVYYLRKTGTAAAVFATARKLSRRYEEFHFKGNFPTPGDEPLVALAMALHNCCPIPFHPEGICCYWEQGKLLRLNMPGGIARWKSDSRRTILLHWGTRFTRTWRYRVQVFLLHLAERRKRSGKSDSHYPEGKFL